MARDSCMRASTVLRSVEEWAEVASCYRHPRVDGI